jgi:gliding motility-associated-like protein
MKKLVLIFIASLCFLTNKSSAQWVEVTNPDGTTQNYGGVNVTVTAVNPAFNGGCNGTYWVSNTGASYTFTFNPPVSAVQFWCDAINTSEETAFLINGQPFSLSTCNVEPLTNNCIDGPCNVLNGYLINNTSFNLCGGLITLYGNITSATLSQQVGNSGTTWDLFIPPGVNIEAPGGDVTAGGNTPLNCGDTLHLTAVATGATSWSWTGPNGFTSTQQNPSFQVNNLGSGQYIVTAMTACGAVTDTVDVVVNPFNMTPTATSNSPVCQNGQLDLSTPFVNNATYNWTGPNGFTSVSQTPVITPVTLLGDGTYTVTVTVNNCTSQPGTTDVEVVALPPLPGVANITYCLGDSTAVPLTATGTNLQWYTVPSGGSPLPGAPTPSTATSGSTTYYVSSTGPAPTSCEGPRAALVVTVLPFTNPPNIAYVDEYCFGTAFVPFTPLTGQNILYYDQPFGGVGSPTPPIVNTSAPGVYHWYASQTVNGCESERLNITITVHPYLEANFSFNVAYGCKADTLTFNNNSVGAIEYDWYFGDGTFSTDPSPTHIYTVQALDTITLISSSYACHDTMVQSVDLRHPLTASFTTDADTICQNQAVNFTNTSIFSTLTGVGPTYQWDFGDGNVSNQQSPSHIFTRTGVYDVTMIIGDFVPCYSAAQHRIYVDSSSGLTLTANASEVCAGETVYLTGNYTDIGLMGVNWDFGDGVTSTKVNDPATHSFEQPGNYTIQLAIDYRVCPDEQAQVSVAVKPQPIINIGQDTVMCPSSSPLVLNDLINASNPAASWLWNTGETTFNIVAKEPNRYWSKVTVNGCSATDSVLVSMDCYVDVPNAFTPDGDGAYDYFFPRQLLSKGVSTFKMTVYNRWGQEVFITTNPAGRGWDGKFNGIDQPQGVYVYMIDVAFKNGVSEQKQGNVTLLR